MKFVHIADLHIGGWRDEKMSALSIESMIYAVNFAINECVDFVLIGGDLFNTALPNIDYIKAATSQLKRLKDNNISVYFVAGSHDYSPSGKTMLDVLENAGLMTNLVRAKRLDSGKLELQFTIDQKTGTKLTGMLGKKLMLEKSFYESLDNTALEAEKGFKIFVFHTAIDELKPEGLSTMESAPLSFLPKGFDYYAGGHVHIRKKYDSPGYKNVIYPGPLFPNSFSELEKLKCGSFYFYNNGNIEQKFVELKKIVDFKLDCTGKSADKVTSEVLSFISSANITDSILLIRLEGKLSLGRPSDISLKSIMEATNSKSPYIVLKSTSGLESEEFEEIKKSFDAVDIEEDIIKEHLGQLKIEGMSTSSEHVLIKKLISNLSTEKQEGETTVTFEDRIIKDSELL